MATCTHLHPWLHLGGDSHPLAWANVSQGKSQSWLTRLSYTITKDTVDSTNGPYDFSIPAFLGRSEGSRGGVKHLTVITKMMATTPGTHSIFPVIKRASVNLGLVFLTEDKATKVCTSLQALVRCRHPGLSQQRTGSQDI